jgi:hypothetical protein
MNGCFYPENKEEATVQAIAQILMMPSRGLQRRGFIGKWNQFIGLGWQRIG